MQRLIANFRFITILNTFFSVFLMAENKDDIGQLAASCIALAKSGKCFPLLDGGCMYFKSIGRSGFVEYWDSVAVNSSKKHLNVWWDSDGGSLCVVFDAQAILDDFDGRDYGRNVFVDGRNFGVKAYLRKGEWEEHFQASHL